MTEMDENPGELIKPAAEREEWKKGGERVDSRRCVLSLSRLGQTLEDSVRRANCCPLHHQSSTNPE